MTHQLYHLLFAIVLLASTLATASVAVDRKSGKKSLRLPTPMMSFDDSSDGDEESLFYNSELNLSEDKPDPEPSALDTLLLEIMQTTNETSVEKCQQYKAQIGDICMAKFVQRTRFRLEEPATLDQNSATGDPTVATNKRPTALLAPAQQICCEFRTTYLRCLLTSINFVCPLTEFNELYTQVQGLSEMCSRFYGKSLKKCRKRYNRNRSNPQQAPPAPVAETVEASTNSPANKY